jgi:hypothetical protein
MLWLAALSAALVTSRTPLVTYQAFDGDCPGPDVTLTVDDTELLLASSM